MTVNSTRCPVSAPSDASGGDVEGVDSVIDGSEMVADELLPRHPPSRATTITIVRARIDRLTCVFGIGLTIKGLGLERNARLCDC
jgi:hypothetical protein